LEFGRPQRGLEFLVRLSQGCAPLALGYFPWLPPRADCVGAWCELGSRERIGRRVGHPAFVVGRQLGDPPNLTFREHLLDASQGLAGALFVFDEAEYYVIVAVVAEAYAGAYGYFGFVQETLAEL